MIFHNIKKTLAFIVHFLKKTSFHHKKKLLMLIAITILYYLAKRKIQLEHLIMFAQGITKIISYLPLPSIPVHRKINQYQSINLNPLMQILNGANIQQIKNKIKEKKSDWNQLKKTVLSGSILSLIVYNIQSFYFVVQNKFQSDFKQFNALQKFQQVMSEMRRIFTLQIPKLIEFISQFLQNQIKQINVRNSYTVDQYCNFFIDGITKIFNKNYFIVKQDNQLLQNNIFSYQDYFKKAQHYFLTPYQYVKQKRNKISKIFGVITNIFSKFSFSIFPKVKCQLTNERYEWAKVGYRIPFKKSIIVIDWPNKQSQTLFKLVLNQIDQTINSTNFSILLYKNAQLNCQILQNRLFLYFQKNNIQSLRMAQGLTVIYRIIREQILAPKILQRREIFYQSQIKKAIAQKNMQQSKKQKLLIKNNPNEINQNQKNQKQQTNQKIQNQFLIRNMHLQQMYQYNQFLHLVKDFQIKYFNERQKIVLNPIQTAQNSPSEDSNQLKKLLNMLTETTDNTQQLQRKD